MRECLLPRAGFGREETPFLRRKQTLESQLHAKRIATRNSSCVRAVNIHWVGQALVRQTFGHVMITFHLGVTTGSDSAFLELIHVPRCRVALEQVNLSPESVSLLGRTVFSVDRQKGGDGDNSATVTRTFNVDEQLFDVFRGQIGHGWLKQDSSAKSKMECLSNDLRFVSRSI